MATELDQTVKEINLRYNEVEKPILTELGAIIGEERLAKFKRFLADKRKAVIKGIPPRDSMSKIVDSLFTQFDETKDEEYVQSFCEDTNRNYENLERDLFIFMEKFITSASDDKLVKDFDLADASLKMGKDTSLTFLSPLEGSVEDVTSKKTKESQDLVTRAKQMAKVLNDELAQPFRSHANQVTLTEKLDTLCQYILVKKQDTEPMEKTRQNLKVLDTLLEQISESKKIEPEMLIDLDSIIGYNPEDEGITERKVAVIEQFKEASGGFTVNGEPVDIEDFTASLEDLSPAPKPSDINLKGEKDVWTPEQVKSIEDALFTLFEDIRNNEGVIPTTEKEVKTENSEGNEVTEKDLVFDRKTITKVNAVSKEFRNAWENYKAKFPALSGKKSGKERMLIINEFANMFTQSGLKANKEGFAATIQKKIKSKNNPFSDAFVELFNEVIQLPNAASAPMMFESGNVVKQYEPKNFSELKEAISKFKCQGAKDASAIILQIGNAVNKVEDEGVDDKNSINKLENVLNKYMKIDVDLNSIVKKEKKSEGDFIKLLNDVTNVCYNPALKELPEQITELPEDFDLENFIKEDFKKLSRKKDSEKTRRELADLIAEIWTESGTIDNLTNYEKLKYLYGAELTDKKDMVNYINELLKRSSRLSPEQINEESLTTKKTPKKTIKKTTKKTTKKTAQPTDWYEKVKEQPSLISIDPSTVEQDKKIIKYETKGGKKESYIFPTIKAADDYMHSVAVLTPKEIEEEEPEPEPEPVKPKKSKGRSLKTLGRKTK